MKKLMFAVAAGGLSSVSFAADAAGPDMTALLSAISFNTLTPAILSVAGLLAVVYVATKGAKMVLSMVKRG